MMRRTALAQRTDQHLDRAIKYAIREARAERKRRRKSEERLDGKIAQVTEAVHELTRIVDRLLAGRGGNGTPA
jgi:hypothetical protein